MVSTYLLSCMLKPNGLLLATTNYIVYVHTFLYERML